MSNVRFAGYSQEVLSELRASDALVFSSRTEGMPVTVIEAMLLGIPIVSTAVVEFPQMLDGYPLGRTTTDHTPQAIASLIADVCSAQERRRVHEETLAALDTHYGAQRMAKEYRAIYEQVRAPY